MVDAVEFGPVGGLGGFGLGVGVGEDMQGGDARGGGGGGERDRGDDGERDGAGANGPGAVGGGGGDEEEVGALQIDGIGRVAVAEVDDGQARPTGIARCRWAGQRVTSAWSGGTRRWSPTRARRPGPGSPMAIVQLKGGARSELRGRGFVLLGCGSGRRGGPGWRPWRRGRRGFGLGL